jgi:hypothetical protein
MDSTIYNCERCRRGSRWHLRKRAAELANVTLLRCDPETVRDIGAFEVQQMCRSVVFEATAIKQIGTGNDLRLRYPTLSGNNYVVQTRSNMVSGSWTSLPGTNTGIGVIMQSIVTNALAAPQGFYRIQQRP